MKYIGSLLLTLIILLSISSCTDNNEVIDYQENVETAKYYTLNQDIFNDMFIGLFQSFYDSVLHQQGTKTICGATVHYDPISPHMATEIEFWYPEWNHLCPDSLYRKNVYLASVTKDFTDTSGKALVTFYDYAVENHWLSGSFTITVEKKDGDESYSYNLEANNVVMHLPDSTNTLLWNCNQYIYWTEGKETPQNFDDDVFSVTGTAFGTDTDDVSYESTIINPIPKNKYCTWIGGGLVEIDVPSQEIKDGHIIYNEEKCDPFFKLEFNGVTFTENLLHIYRPGLDSN